MTLKDYRKELVITINEAPNTYGIGYQRNYYI